MYASLQWLFSFLTCEADDGEAALSYNLSIVLYSPLIYPPLLQLDTELIAMPSDSFADEQLMIGAYLFACTVLCVYGCDMHRLRALKYELKLLIFVWIWPHPDCHYCHPQPQIYS